MAKKKNKLGPDNNTHLAQILTPKMAKLGPDNNFTAYAYAYIYILDICWHVHFQGAVLQGFAFWPFLVCFVVLGGTRKTDR